MARLDRVRRAFGRGGPTSDVSAEPAPEADTLPIDTAIDPAGVAAGGLDAGALTVLVLADVGGLGSDRHREWVRRAVALGGQVLAAAHDVHAGPHTRHAPVVAPDGAELVSPTVFATIGGAIAAALPRVRGGRLLVVDGAIEAPESAAPALVDALVDGVVGVQAVVRDASDVVASAGAVLPRAGYPTASFLAGFPVEDAAAMTTRRVFAAEEPFLVLRSAAAGVPPRTIDVPLTLAAWTRAAADRDGGTVEFADVGRVYRPAPERPRRLDADAETIVRSWSGRDDAGLTATLEASGLRVAQIAAGPAGRPVALRSPLVRLEWAERVILDRGERLRWSIKIAAHPGARGDDWGDTYFARDLAAALRRLGQDVVVDHRESHVRLASEHLDDVSLVLRGLDDTPVNPSAVNVLWVISHPDLVTGPELGRFDLRFAAGRTWAERTGAATGLPIGPLLQATDPARFHPGDPDDRFAVDTVFVGKTRGVERPMVRDAVAAGLDLAVWGEGWAGVVPEAVYRGAFLPNDDLPALYRSARVVLNDHWADMARDGFLSNRLFDAAASGAFVVSDAVPDVDALFHGAVRVATDVDELRRLAESGDAEASRAARADRGRRIGAEHSFDARAAVLLDAVRTRRAQR